MTQRHPTNRRESPTAQGETGVSAVQGAMKHPLKRPVRFHEVSMLRGSTSRRNTGADRAHGGERGVSPKTSAKARKGAK